ncbi:helix-turn-helix domain-containing protein [Candidatus Woesearchaeota archaeon]|nr:helix-turn-helix domain-containing protein [Candidatus Woesearchaeota archaeon]
MRWCKFIKKLFNCKKPVENHYGITGDTQSEVVLKHLIKYRVLNTRQAFMYYDITNLSSVIYSLRNQGYEIDTHETKTTAKFGGMITVTSYLM